MLVSSNIKTAGFCILVFVVGYFIGSYSAGEGTVVSSSLGTLEKNAGVPHVSRKPLPSRENSESLRSVERLGSVQPTASNPFPMRSELIPYDQNDIKRFAAMDMNAFMGDLQLLYSLRGMHYSSFCNVVSLKNPFDFWTQQLVISEVAPDVIVETGVFRGASAVMYSTVLGQINPDGKVIAIDVVDRVEATTKNLPAWERVDLMIGSSTDPNIFATVKAKVEGKKCLVILDSRHDEQYVTEELNMYSAFVSVGSYLIVEDTAHNHPIKVEATSPWESVFKFLEKNDSFKLVKDQRIWNAETTTFQDHYMIRVK